MVSFITENRDIPSGGEGIQVKPEAKLRSCWMTLRFTWLAEVDHRGQARSLAHRMSQEGNSTPLLLPNVRPQKIIPGRTDIQANSGGSKRTRS